MGKQPIFITGRFRAGTSFLWQMFDRLPGFCAWYEPLHPQLLSHVAHIKPKADHVGIDDYWRSYQKHPEFIEHYNSDFAHNSLWLESDSSYPELKSYLDHMVALSGNLQPVLQFNRMDFRLPWLKANYPDATIIHIKRNPLQLWHSQRKHIGSISQKNASETDAYELLQWRVSLSSLLPFLSKNQSEHAFYHCYAIQKLSDLIGARCADVSLSLDEDVFESDQFAQKLEKHVGLTANDWLAVQQKKHVSKHTAWDEGTLSELSDLMTEVELVLEASGLIEFCGIKSLAEIKHLHGGYWDSQNLKVDVQLQEILHAMAVQQTELTDLMSVKNKLVEELEKYQVEQTVQK